MNGCWDEELELSHERESRREQMRENIAILEELIV